MGLSSDSDEDDDGGTFSGLRVPAAPGVRLEGAAPVCSVRTTSHCFGVESGSEDEKVGHAAFQLHLPPNPPQVGGLSLQHLLVDHLKRKNCE